MIDFVCDAVQLGKCSVNILLSLRDVGECDRNRRVLIGQFARHPSEETGMFNGCLIPFHNQRTYMAVFVGSILSNTKQPVNLFL